LLFFSLNNNLPGSKTSTHVQLLANNPPKIPVGCQTAWHTDIYKQSEQTDKSKWDKSDTLCKEPVMIAGAITANFIWNKAYNKEER
jgi:hypothetical protein